MLLSLVRLQFIFKSNFFIFFQDHEEVESPEIHFEPIVNLPQVEIKSLEEEEEELLKLYVQLFLNVDL